MNKKKLTRLAISFLAFIFFLVPISPVYAQLVNPNATPAAIKLKHLIDTLYGKKIISGQAFESVDENWLSIISDASGGKQPAILSLDFMNSTPWRVSKGTDPDTTTNMAIDWVKKQGGLVEMHWHWDAPRNTNFDTWQGFYSKNTTFDLAYAMNNPTSDDYQLLIRDMDIVANLLKRMQDSSIAILWRPLHEAEGTWFWWGAKGGDACKALYRLMYQRFVNIHGLNNLIWVWNSYGTTKQNWYPGDDMVDIIAWDYPDYNQSTGSWSQYQHLFGDKGKIFAIGEDGKLTDPNILDKQHWSYFITWAYMIKDPSQVNGKNTAAWINQVYNDSRVITLDDLVPGPKAKAGNPQIIFDHDGDGTELVELDGSKSFTNAGIITAYTWSLNNEEIASGVKPKVALGIGNHIIKLTISTNLNETSSALVTIKVIIPSLTLNKTFLVSSTEANLGNIAANAVDGNMDTRWSSTYSDPQWYQVDLGKRYDIKKVIIHWEFASARDYSIEESNDGIKWTSVIKKNNMPAGQRSDTINNLPGGARFIRMYGTARTSAWGYSIFEFEAYGTENAHAEPVGQVLSARNFDKNLELDVFPTVLKKDDTLNINIPSLKNMGNIKIYDITGKFVMHSKAKSNLMQIKIDNKFSSGIYFLILDSPNGAFTKKFIVE
jgi:hypothetical protein